MKMLLVVCVLMTGCAHAQLDQADDLATHDYGKIITTLPYDDKGCKNGEYCIATKVTYEHGWKYYRRNGSLASEGFEGPIIRQ